NRQNENRRLSPLSEAARDLFSTNPREAEVEKNEIRTESWNDLQCLFSSRSFIDRISVCLKRSAEKTTDTGLVVNDQYPQSWTTHVFSPMAGIPLSPFLLLYAASRRCGHCGLPRIPCRSKGQVLSPWVLLGRQHGRTYRTPARVHLLESPFHDRELEFPAGQRPGGPGFPLSHLLENTSGLYRASSLAPAPLEHRPRARRVDRGRC